jgi:hypothetical protein
MFTGMFLCVPTPSAGRSTESNGSACCCGVKPEVSFFASEVGIESKCGRVISNAQRKVERVSWSRGSTIPQNWRGG